MQQNRSGRSDPVLLGFPSSLPPFTVPYPRARFPPQDALTLIYEADGQALFYRRADQAPNFMRIPQRVHLTLSDMPKEERGYLIVRHEIATGADCDGCLIIEKCGDMADLKCHRCGTVVDTVPIDRAGQRLMELASDEICSEWCPHCGSLNTFPGFSAIEAFICRDCGEGVNVERPVH